VSGQSLIETSSLPIKCTEKPTSTAEYSGPV
jgi:hypothetical protein